MIIAAAPLPANSAAIAGMDANDAGKSTAALTARKRRVIRSMDPRMGHLG